MTACICCKFIGFFIIFWVLAAFLAFLSLFQIRTDGTILLEHAEGTVTITREKDSMIPHVCA